MVAVTNTRSSSLFSVVVFSLILLVSSSSPPSIQEKCANEFTKVQECLKYASGKEPVPTESCCKAVGEMQSNDPVCLCFILQQTHAGVQSLKSLGLQFDKLVQMPSACKLANASLTECPKLLNISPNSPDYNIFTNSSAVITNTTGGTPTKAGTQEKQDASRGFSRVSHFSVSFVAATAIFAIFFLVHEEGM